MQRNRELTAVYIVLGKSFIETVPYDAQGAFVLLHSITEGLGQDVPRFLDVAAHLHVVAAVGADDGADRDACGAMAQLVGILEGRLVRPSRV